MSGRRGFICESERGWNAGFSESEDERPFTSIIPYNNPRLTILHIACTIWRRRGSHHFNTPTGPWFDLLLPHLTLVPAKVPTKIFGRELRHFAHRSDVSLVPVFAPFLWWWLDEGADGSCAGAVAGGRIDHQAGCAFEHGWDLSGYRYLCVSARPSFDTVSYHVDRL